MRRMIKAIVTCLVIVTCAAPVLADEASDAFDMIAGTAATEATPIMNDGIVSGCQVTFQAYVKDDLYRNGSYLNIIGGAGLMINGQPKQLVGFVKIIAQTVDETADGGSEPVSDTPDRVYLIGKGYTTNLAKAYAGNMSDQPSTRFTLFPVDPTAQMIADGLVAGRLTFAFNQLHGSSDLQVQSIFPS